jgi:hypothetical protein
MEQLDLSSSLVQSITLPVFIFVLVPPLTQTMMIYHLMRRNCSIEIIHVVIINGYFQTGPIGH